jgi:hypothetical protein
LNTQDQPKMQEDINRFLEKDSVSVIETNIQLVSYVDVVLHAQVVNVWFIKGDVAQSAFDGALPALPATPSTPPTPVRGDSGRPTETLRRSAPAAQTGVLPAATAATASTATAVAATLLRGNPSARAPTQTPAVQQLPVQQAAQQQLLQQQVAQQQQQPQPQPVGVQKQPIQQQLPQQPMHLQQPTQPALAQQAAMAQNAQTPMQQQQQPMQQQVPVDAQQQQQQPPQQVQVPVQQQQQSQRLPQQQFQTPAQQAQQQFQLPRVAIQQQPQQQQQMNSGLAALLSPRVASNAMPVGNGGGGGGGGMGRTVGANVSPISTSPGQSVAQQQATQAPAGAVLTRNAPISLASINTAMPANGAVGSGSGGAGGIVTRDSTGRDGNLAGGSAVRALSPSRTRQRAVYVDALRSDD